MDGARLDQAKRRQDCARLGVRRRFAGAVRVQIKSVRPGMAAAFREIPKLSRSRSGVLLLREKSQTQIKVQAGSFSRSLARRSCRSKHGSAQAASDEFMRGRSRTRMAHYSCDLRSNACSAVGTEYAWARRWLRKVRRIASDVVSGRKRTAIRDFASSRHRGEHEKRTTECAEHKAHEPE